MLNTSFSDFPDKLNQDAYRLFLNKLHSKKYIPNTVLLSIYLVIGIVGNITVILVYQFRLRQNSDGRYFIAPLVVIDLTALIVTFTLNFIKNTQPINFPGNLTCKIITYLSYVTISTSLYLLAAIAIQRYLKICRPFGRQMNLLCKRLSVCFCGAISICIYIPILFYFGLVEKQSDIYSNITEYHCSVLPGPEIHMKRVKMFQAFGFFGTIGDVLFITVLYSLITVSIVKRLRKTKVRTIKTENVPMVSHENTSTYAPKAKKDENSVTSDTEPTFDNTQINTSIVENPSPKHGYDRSAFRISFMFMTISIMGFLAYLPSWILIIMETSNPSFWTHLSGVSFQVCLTLRRMYMLNHLVNPFIYGVFDKLFRQEIKKFFFNK